MIKIKRDENIVYLRRLINVFLVSMLIFFLVKGILINVGGFPLFKMFLLMFLALFCHLTLKKLYYTYWTFGLIFIALILIDIVAALWILPWLGTVGLILLLGFLAINYFLASPIYYPQVNWWEYDFRYRTDLRGNILSDDSKIIECRIADLRRNAGCVHSFANFQTGTELKLEVEIGTVTKTSRAKIISMRKGIPGRPSIYGVLFPKEVQAVYQEMQRFWRQAALTKSGDKFKKV